MFTCASVKPAVTGGLRLSDFRSRAGAKMTGTFKTFIGSHLQIEGTCRHVGVAKGWEEEREEEEGWRKVAGRV